MREKNEKIERRLGRIRAGWEEFEKRGGKASAEDERRMKDWRRVI
jgi:hypothetical protein